MTFTVTKMMPVAVPATVEHFEWKRKCVIKLPCTSCEVSINKFDRWAAAWIYVEGESAPRGFRLCEPCGIRAERSIAETQEKP